MLKDCLYPSEQTVPDPVPEVGVEPAAEVVEVEVAEVEVVVQGLEVIGLVPPLFALQNGIELDHHWLQKLKLEGVCLA